MVEVSPDSLSARTRRVLRRLNCNNGFKYAAGFLLHPFLDDFPFLFFTYLEFDIDVY